MSIVKKTIVAALGVVALNQAVAMEMPGYYEEPGFNPNRAYQNGQGGETIEPFSGGVKFHNVDLVVPTNGELDIVVHRNYNNPRGEIPDGSNETWAGVGWSVHFGRIIQPDGNLCIAKTHQTSSARFPFFEMADGSVKKLYLNDKIMGAETSSLYITADRWRGDVSNCTAVGSDQSITLTAPGGTKYEFKKHAKANDALGVSTRQIWYVTKITDLSGNYLRMTYTDYWHETLLTKVTSSDGKSIGIKYDDTDAENPVIKSISQVGNSGRKVTYSYKKVPLSQNQRFLSTVNVAGEKTWKYKYFGYWEGATRDNSVTYSNYCKGPYDPGVWGVGGSASSGYLSLCKVTYPHGAISSYTYTKQQMDQPSSTYTHALKQKKLKVGGKTYLWEYSYSQNSDEDTTTISNPDSSKTIYKHYGSQYGSAWRTGLTKSVTYTKGGGTLGFGVSREASSLATKSANGTWYIGIGGSSTTDNSSKKISYTWDKQKISSASNLRNTTYENLVEDSDTYVPIQTKVITIQDGTQYKTTYSDYDDYGNAREVKEWGNDGAYRMTRYGFNSSYKKSKWLINHATLEEVSNSTGGSYVGSGPQIYNKVTRKYNSIGKVSEETVNGITQSYRYHTSSHGELYIHKDAKGNETKFSNYSGGIPRKEVRPVDANHSIEITRVVNSDGTIRSESVKELDGTVITTSFGYDNLDRITSITKPQGSRVSIGYSKNSETLTRGDFKQVKTLDGMGQVVKTTYTDKGNPSSQIWNKVAYDSKGRVRYKYNPNSDSKRIAYKYDVLDRVVKTTDQAGNATSIEYLSNNQEKITDPEGVVTKNHYRSYGNPAEKNLIKVENFDDNGDLLINRTVINRDLVGRIKNVKQGISGVGRGVMTRTYRYNNKYQLESINDPEVGITDFRYDANGNLTQQRVNSSSSSQWITYNYDAQNRQTGIVYPAATGSVDSAENIEFDYNNRGLVTAMKTDSVQRNYGYDKNGNLDWENLVVDGNTYTLDYGFNNLDMLEQIEYPAQGDIGTLIYNPDAFGRPAEVRTGDGHMVFAEAVTWHPSGSVHQLHYGNGHVETTALDSRLWVQSINTPGLLSLEYGHHKNGNISSITGMPDTDYSSMTYDGMGRLKSMTPTEGMLTIYRTNRMLTDEPQKTFTNDIEFDYDAQGNITRKKIATRLVEYDYDENGRLNAATNEVVFGKEEYSFDYDNYGNIISDGKDYYRYNHAGAMVSLNNGEVNYLYDGNRMRVKKEKSGSPDAYFFYSSGGDLIGEYRADGTSKEYVMLAGKAIAEVNVEEEIPEYNLVLPENAINGEIDTDGSFSLSWDSVPDAISYEIDISTDYDFSENVQSIYSGSDTSAQIQDLDDGTYYVRIRSCSANSCDEWVVSPAPITVQHKYIPIMVGDMTIIIPKVD